MASFENRPDFRNSTALLKNKSRSLNKFIRRYLADYNSFNQGIAGAVPSRIKDLIKLVKYWHSKFVLSGQEQYGHELVRDDIETATVRAWKKYNSPKTINMAIAFKAVMEELRDHGLYDGERQAALDTMRKPMFVDVCVTKNWCRTASVRNNGLVLAPSTATSRPSVLYEDFRDFPASASSTINKFISDKLQPDDSFSGPIHEALDILCRFLENKLDDVNRIIKSGSMGKGTALRGKSDLDCVMILNKIKDVEELKRKVGHVQEELIAILKAYKVSDWRITVNGKTSFCVKFSMKSTTSSNTTVDVDLLPTFDKNSLELNELYRQMKTKDETTRPYYSAALAELQIEFVKTIPGRVKDLIRLVKYWCKEYVVPVRGGQGVYPNSYLLELVTIDAWEESGEPNTFNMAVGFRAVMEKLRLHEKLDIVWDKNYRSSLVDAKSAPRVVDPANPFNNVYDRVTQWPRVVNVVNETLKKPFVKGAKVTTEWQ